MDLFYLLTLLSLVLVVLGVFGFARVRRHASKQPERTIGASRVTLRIDGQEREFFYYIPKGGGEGRPLVVALHGGMASAFADRSLARMAWAATSKMSVTLKLTMHFFETVRLHNWLEAHPRLESYQHDLVQVSADFLINGEKLAVRADATFRTLRRPQKQG